MKTNRNKITVLSVALLAFSLTAMGQVRPSAIKTAKSAASTTAFKKGGFTPMFNIPGFRDQLLSIDLGVVSQNPNLTSDDEEEGEFVETPDYDYQVSLLENGTQLHFEVLNNPADVALLTQWNITIKYYDAIPDLDTTSYNPWTYHGFPSTSTNYFIDGNILSVVIDLPASDFADGLCSVDYEIDFVTDGGIDSTGLKYYEVGNCMTSSTGIESTMEATATTTGATVDLGIALSSISGLDYWAASFFVFNSQTGEYAEIEFPESQDYINADDASGSFSFGNLNFTPDRFKYRIRMTGQGSSWFYPDSKRYHLLEVDIEE